MFVSLLYTVYIGKLCYGISCWCFAFLFNVSALTARSNLLIGVVFVALHTSKDFGIWQSIQKQSLGPMAVFCVMLVCCLCLFNLKSIYHLNKGNKMCSYLYMPTYPASSENWTWNLSNKCLLLIMFSL